MEIFLGPVINTLRRAAADPAARDAGDVASGFPHSGFIERISSDLRGSAVLRSSVLWPCDSPREAGPVRAEGTAAHGHQGLGWYVYTCWARELGCVLRPDLVWVTVASELAGETVAAPAAYRPLFTGSAGGKETVRVLVGSEESQMPLDTLARSLAGRMADKRLAELVANSDFAPYYDYVTRLCGIPRVRVDGSSDEWQRLARMCEELADHVEACRSPRSAQFAAYARDAAGLVREIDAYAHCDLSTPADLEAAQTFFSGLFWITANCGSGHPYYCRGWLSRLYFVTVQEHEALRRKRDPGDERWDVLEVHQGSRQFASVLDFPTHMGRVAWRNEESGRMFCSCTGILYSTLSADGMFLLPCYGQLQYEVTDKKLFLQLSNS
eukprot:m51a1_g7206 hypothetical protein (382) ;mRNA; r:218879-220492